MGLWILPSAGLREQTSIKTGSRLLSPPCLVIRQVPAAACWTPIREDSSLGRKTVMGHGSELNSSLTLPCFSPPSSLPCVLPGPSRLPLPGASDPQLSQAYTPLHSCLPKSLQPPQQGLPPIPPDSQAARHQQTAKPQAIIVFSQPGQVSSQLTLPPPPRMLSK